MHFVFANTYVGKSALIHIAILIFYDYLLLLATYISE